MRSRRRGISSAVAERKTWWRRESGQSASLRQKEGVVMGMSAPHTSTSSATPPSSASQAPNLDSKRNPPPLTVRTLVQRALQASNQAPVPRPPPPAVLDRKPLRRAALAPEAEVQQVRREDEVGRRGILALRMQLVRAPGRGAVVALLHLRVEHGGGSARAGHGDGDIDAVVADVQGAAEHVRVWGGINAGVGAETEGVAEEREKFGVRFV
ncbi:hypothetical protein LTR16_008610, partial [Cryomyces antarcticus]